MSGTGAKSPKSSPKILCVDDEPNVLEGLLLHLRRKFEVETAVSGAAGLEILERSEAVTVVMSDMHMPGMNGSEFLSRARQIVPDAARILLTGQADIDSAIAAVNNGQIFRFLTKPCPPPVLLTALEAGVQQYRLVTAERELLEHTLHGCIKALADVLAVTSPISFGRAMRIKQVVSDLADALGMRERWQVEVAAMLSQLGFITLPPVTADRVYYGRGLSSQEQAMVAKIPSVTDQLISNIPRLEVVREMLKTYTRSYSSETVPEEASKQLAQRGAQMLRIAVDFDALETQGLAASLVFDTMRGRADRYNPAFLNALAEIRATKSGRDEIRELPLSAIRVGMIFAEDVKTSSGTLLVTGGYEVTESFVERVRNFSPGAVKEPLRVIVRRTTKVFG